MLNNEASAPPEIAYVKVVLASGSVAVTVYTVEEVFSAVVALEPELIIGVSFRLVTVIATALVTDVVPSETLTVMLYTLLAPSSIGASKLGSVLKVTTPVEGLILNNELSTPPEISYVSVSDVSGSVAVTV